MAASSIYQPLPNIRTTRLITIEQRAETERFNLRIRLHLVDIDEVATPTEYDHWGESEDTVDTEAIEFDALSYTWGPPLSTAACAEEYGPANDVEIAVVSNDGSEHALKIGRNLYEVLSHILTMRYNRRPLWVDAICINQEDIAEREKHVLLMSDVYHKARTVLVWLGRDDPGSADVQHLLWIHEDFVMDVAQHLQKKGPLTRDDFQLTADQSGVHVRSMDDCILTGDTLRALYRFYSQRRYLKRAWVVQEVSLAHRCRIMLGDKLLYIQPFAFMSGMLSDLGGLAPLFWPEHAEQPDGSELLSLAQNMSKFQNLALRRGNPFQEIHYIHGPTDERGYHLAILESKLSSGIVRGASNPRDHIYSLLGLAQAVMPLSSPPILPDYSDSVQEVFTAVTTALLEGLPHCTALSMVAARTQHADYVQNLPSWVPDYAAYGNGAATLVRQIHQLSGRLPVFSACKDDEDNARLSIDGARFTVSARRVSEVDMLFNLHRSDVSGYLSSAAIRLRDTIHAVAIVEMCLKLTQNNLTQLVEPLLRVLCYGAMELENDVDFRLIWRRIFCLSIPLAQAPLDQDPELAEAVERLWTLYDQLSTLLPVIPSRAFWEVNKQNEITQVHLRQDPSTAREVPLEVLERWQAAWSPYEQDLSGSSLTDFKVSGGVTDVQTSRDLFNRFTDLLYNHRVDFRISQYDTFFTSKTPNVGRIPVALQPGDELWLICRARLPFILRPIANGEYQLLGEAYVHGGMFGEFIDNGQAGPIQDITIV